MSESEASAFRPGVTPLGRSPYRRPAWRSSRFERVRDALRERLSAKTVAATLTTCAAVFKLAQRRGYVYVTSNPAALAERPRRAVVELGGDDEGSGVRPEEVLSADEIKRLLEAAEPGRWRSLFTTVAATGLRVEEVLALRWGDLELLDGHGRLFVRRSLSWARGVGEEGRVRPKFFEPKTKAGRASSGAASGEVEAGEREDLAALVRVRVDSRGRADNGGAASARACVAGGDAEGV